MSCKDYLADSSLAIIYDRLLSWRSIRPVVVTADGLHSELENLFWLFACKVPVLHNSLA